MRSVWRLVALSIVLSAATAGCVSSPVLPAPDEVQLTPLRSISRVHAHFLLFLSGVKGIPVHYRVDTYRMLYKARINGKAVRLSGLLALPRGVEARRLVSFQHGTTTTRSAVPSKPDDTGISAAIAFAGNGYALVAPDYPGLGESAGRHPYLVVDAVAPAVVAMIQSARRLEPVPRSPVFLAGFSEGAWASLAALDRLEARGQTVLGSAQVAGAYDLRRVSVPFALKGGAPSDSLYLAYAAWGQAAYYGHPLDSVLTRDYARRVDALFSGATPQQIIDGLPERPRKMFNQAFLEAVDGHGSNWLLDSFQANSLMGVTPRAPVRLYYGSRDRDVSPEESLAAARAFTSRGADASAVDVGPVAHDPSMLAAAPLILDWLKELDAAAHPPN